MDRLLKIDPLKPDNHDDHFFHCPRKKILSQTRQALTEQFLKACPLDGQYERFTRPIDNRTRPPQM